MAIEKWQPFGTVREFDDLFGRFFGNRPAPSLTRSTEPESWSIPLDVVQGGDSLVVTASVPGITLDEIDVSVDDNILTIRAESAKTNGTTAKDSSAETNGYLLRERRTGSYYRALRLPETVDYENTESTFKDGVLTIRMPKLESKKARKLEISAVYKTLIPSSYIAGWFRSKQAAGEVAGGLFLFRIFVHAYPDGTGDEVP